MAKETHTKTSEGKKKPSVIKIALYVLGGLFVLGVIGSLGADETPSKPSDTSEDTQVSQDTTEKESEPSIKYQVVDLSSFVKEYDENQISAEKKYTDSHIQTSGYVGNISEDILGDVYITLNPSNDEYYFGTYIQCYVTDEDSVTSLKNGGKATIKGLVQDQTLGNIIIKECIIVE